MKRINRVQNAITRLQSPEDLIMARLEIDRRLMAAGVPLDSLSSQLPGGLTVLLSVNEINRELELQSKYNRKVTELFSTIVLISVLAVAGDAQSLGDTLEGMDTRLSALLTELNGLSLQLFGASLSPEAAMKVSKYITPIQEVIAAWKTDDDGYDKRRLARRNLKEVCAFEGSVFEAMDNLLLALERGGRPSGMTPERAYIGRETVLLKDRYPKKSYSWIASQLIARARLAQEYSAEERWYCERLEAMESPEKYVRAAAADWKKSVNEKPVFRSKRIETMGK